MGVDSRITLIRRRPVDPIEATMRGPNKLPSEMLYISSVAGFAFPQPRPHEEVAAQRAAALKERHPGLPLVFRRPPARPIVKSRNSTFGASQSSGWFDALVARIKKSCDQSDPSRS